MGFVGDDTRRAGLWNKPKTKMQTIKDKKSIVIVGKFVVTSMEM